MKFLNPDFQIFLNKLSLKKPNELKLIVLDNSAFHKGKDLEIPENIILIFLPLYSPELNPAELVWLNMKRRLINKIFKAMEELKLELNQIVQEMITETFIKNLCGFDYLDI